MPWRCRYGVGDDDIKSYLDFSKMYMKIYIHDPAYFESQSLVLDIGTFQHLVVPIPPTG